MSQLRLAKPQGDTAPNPLRDHAAEAIVLGSILRTNTLYPQNADLVLEVFDDETAGSGGW